MTPRRARLALTLAALACLPLRGAEAADPAQSRAEDLARKFVEAVDTDDATARRKLLGQIYAPETIESFGLDKLTAQAETLRDQFGALELHHGEIFTFRTGSGVRLTLHVFARGKDRPKWLDFQFRTDGGSPPLATQLVFVAEVTEPVALPNGGIGDPATLDWLGHYVDRLVAENAFSGSILIASGDDVLFDRTVGVADAAGKVPNTSETRFNMASGGKMFTAVAIAQLVERSKLAWDTPLLTAVDGFPDSPRARKVTLAQLLTHTSGIGEYWTDEYEKAWPRLRTLRDTLPFVLEAGFVAEPGSEFRYSNSNFILLGLAIEKTSGMSYYDYVAKAVLEPAGMKETGYPPRDAPGVARPLVPDGDSWAVADRIFRGTSAGGAVSTPRDLLRFARALVAGKLVRPATLKVMTTTKTAGLSDATDYGYGFELHPYPGGTWFGHGGQAEGTDFAFAVFPEQDLTFILFGNRGGPAFDSLKRNVLRLITGER